MTRKASYRNGAATLYFTPVCDGQAFITAVLDESPDCARAAADVYEKVADLLVADGLEIVHERMFGSLASHEAAEAARRSVLAGRGIPAETPVTYLQGRPLWGEGLAGVNLLAVRAGDPQAVWTIRDEAGRPRGRGWRRQGATFLMLQNLHGRIEQAEADNSRTAQAGRMFDQADALLRGQKTDYRIVTRTWLYLSRILEWYGDLNTVRSAKYDGFGLMPKPDRPGGEHILLPASTGIEGDAHTGAAATLDLLATVLEPGSPIEIHQMTNPRQKDAFRYGSAFSRGAAIRMPEVTWISISGTAAIDEAGVSLLPGDFRGQMNKTLDIIEALIAQEGAGLEHLCDTSAFVKRVEDVDAFHEVAAERGLSDLAGIRVIADVCRDDLLFEMDGAAVVPRV